MNKIANTNTGYAICPCIGCNHKLFCAVGHFSFVLWFLKKGQLKIHLVWKTTLLLNTVCCQGFLPAVELSLFVSRLFSNLTFIFILNYTESTSKHMVIWHSPGLYGLWVCLCDSVFSLQYGVGCCALVLLLLRTLKVTKNGHFRSHTHCNLTLDIRSPVIRALD